MSSRHDPTPRTSAASSWTKLLVRKEIHASSGWSYSAFRGSERSKFSFLLSTFSKAGCLHRRMKQVIGGVALLLLTAAPPLPPDTNPPRCPRATGLPTYFGTLSVERT